MAIDANGNIIPDGLAATSTVLKQQPIGNQLYAGNPQVDFSFNTQGTPVTTNGVDITKSLGTSGIGSNNDGSTSWWQGLKDSFNPTGTSGRSYAGNVMDAVGTGVGIGTGLAGAYYTKKNYDLQKENQEYLKNREAQNDARKATFATNVGGTY